ncbi:iron-sulfur cluster biosynthesis family protein [Kibdelosporangium phytohabitans]|uniref:Iron-sulfur cluster biosynthesis protein n=1 Tax=Kibdelosporangium phytohabitans TaxID=860235 RepID=A0A0N9HVA3_9PSEU|nr:iron-sulfur cluster biosynthesis family protein [Kibdelosporangium phytohabitans]ALG08993.1 iron-sulfur cluster biosynthesis protein [Kibdelosporangium phytohabitans]MBE1469830.1 Fe-S cluster assembly iron-binding protein IscA [Kibdelosporangium phytohabitans]
MLAVTDAAAQAIGALTSQNGQQEAEGGLRFSLQSSDDAGAQLALAVTKQPEQGDQVVTTDNGASVYLERAAAEFLDDKVLDVQQNNEGEIAFALAPQGV